jgi:hypothetical protein
MKKQQSGSPSTRVRTYYFCAPGCKKAFDEEPEMYIIGAPVPTSNVKDTATNMAAVVAAAADTNKPLTVPSFTFLFYCNVPKTTCSANKSSLNAPTKSIFSLIITLAHPMTLY